MCYYQNCSEDLVVPPWNYPGKPIVCTDDIYFGMIITPKYLFGIMNEYKNGTFEKQMIRLFRARNEMPYSHRVSYGL